MNLNTLIPLILCFATSFVGAMDQNWPTHPDQGSGGQRLRPSRANPNPRYLTHHLSTQRDTIEINELVDDYLNQSLIIQKNYPKIFADKPIIELYPGELTPTQLLQVAMARNDLALVQKCLAQPDIKNSFTPDTSAKMQSAIKLAEEVKNICLKGSSKIQSGQQYVTTYLDQKLKLISATIDLAIGSITGPGSTRSSLTWLCGSPETIEPDNDTTFKGNLVVGLCKLLLPAHLEKAKSSKNPKKYLDDLSAINSAVWSAYEKIPEELDTLLRVQKEARLLTQQYAQKKYSYDKKNL